MDCIARSIDIVKKSMLDTLLDGFMYFRLGNSPLPRQVLYAALRPAQQATVDVNSLPIQNPNTVRIVLISDTHDRHYCIGELPKGDVFIHAGDICMTSRLYSSAAAEVKLQQFNEWLGTIPCKHKIVIGGNHDCHLESIANRNRLEVAKLLSNAIYLQNETVRVEDLIFFGSPVSRGRSKNSAFQSDACHEAARCNLRDQAVDVLVTHGPERDLRRICQPQAHIYGHVHNAHGVHYEENVAVLNACLMDGRYNPSYPPVVFDIPRNPKARS